MKNAREGHGSVQLMTEDDPIRSFLEDCDDEDFMPGKLADRDEGCGREEAVTMNSYVREIAFAAYKAYVRDAFIEYTDGLL